MSPCLHLRHSPSLQQNCAARHAALSRSALLRLAWAGLSTVLQVSAHLSSHCSGHVESANSSGPDPLSQRVMLGPDPYHWCPLEAADCAGAAIVICVYVSRAIAKGYSQVHRADNASILGRAILCRVQISLEAMEVSYGTHLFTGSLPKLWCCCLHTPLTTLIQQNMLERGRAETCALGPFTSA